MAPISLLMGCSQADSGERIVLDSGVTVLMRPIEGVDHVAVEAFYDVGFIDEPKDMTQAAHLLEHLVCYGATESFKQKEAMERLNSMGMANAETLPTCTHYDYVLPADKLALAIQIEKERLTSLAFDTRLIKTEAGRCYQETDFVEANPASGMVKHAFMAFSQAWRFNAKQALVRGGLEDMDIDQLRAFHRHMYRPDNLRLVIVGNFQPDQVKKLLKENLGQIKQPSQAADKPIAWAKVPKRQTVNWDAKVSGVCLAFPPPQDRASSAAISLFGTLLMQQLSIDAELKQVADVTMCTNFTWKADPLPFFVYSAAKKGQSLEDVEQVLTARFKAAVDRAKSSTAQLPMLVTQLQMQATSLNRQMIEQQAQMLQRMQRIDEKRATGMVLGQAAINWAMLDQLMGENPEQTATELRSMVGPKLEELIDQTLDEGKMFVTYVVPGP
jgi:predicted Zn-dependent peptidase